MADGVLSGISETGQQVSEAAGTAYKDIGKTEIPTYADYNASAASDTLNSEATIKSGLDYVDKDKSTVRGQLSSLLSSDSSYIKQAEEAGKRQAQERGMLNTSMAAGAARSAAIQQALPIAQQDAQTYATAQGMEQSAQNQQTQTKTEAIVSGELSKQNAAIAAADQRLQNQFSAQMQGASESNKVLLQDMQNQHQTFLHNMEQEHQALLQQEDITAKKAEYIASSASTIMQNYQISVENMLTDPDFLNLGTEAVNNGINQLQQIARNSINFVGASSGVDLTGFVDAYLADVSVMTETA